MEPGVDQPASALLAAPDPHRLRIAYIAAGAAGMYCGSCLHDNTLAAALLARGHEVVLVPAYTPLRTDEGDVSTGRIFYGAVNVYLEQAIAAWGRAPALVRRVLDHPRLLGWVGRLGSSTDAAGLGPLTLSVLRGEAGRQARALEELADWLAAFRPDVVLLGNALLLGLARRLRERSGAVLVCGLAGEDLFLAGLREPWRAAAWEELRYRAAGADLFLAPNLYYAGVMATALGLERGRIAVVPLGISLDGWGGPRAVAAADRPVTVAYLARICPEKGLHLLAEAFVLLAARFAPGQVRLAIAGYLGRRDRAYFTGVRRRLVAAGLADVVEIVGEVDRAEKVRFLRRADVLAVPTTYRESKGLFALEALAAGTPVVAPAHGAFPELIGETGGGLLVEPGSPPALAGALAELARDPERRWRLGETGRQSVHAGRSAATMAAATEATLRTLVASPLARTAGRAVP